MLKDTSQLHRSHLSCGQPSGAWGKDFQLNEPRQSSKLALNTDLIHVSSGPFICLESLGVIVGRQQSGALTLHPQPLLLIQSFSNLSVLHIGFSFAFSFQEGLCQLKQNLKFKTPIPVQL